jgi:hypothetical protein
MHYHAMVARNWHERFLDDGQLLPVPSSHEKTARKPCNNDTRGTLTLALRHTAQLTRVPKHVIQRDLGNQRKLVIPHFRVDDRTLALVDRTNHITLELDRRDDLDRHDGFQYDGAGAVEGFFESANGGQPECQFVRVVRMGSTILEHKADAVDVVSC